MFRDESLQFLLYNPPPVIIHQKNPMVRTATIHFQHLSDISSFKEYSVQALMRWYFCYISRKRSPEALHQPPPGQAYGGLYSIQYVLIYAIIIVTLIHV